MPTDLIFDPRCRRCERLSSFLKQVKQEHPDYHAAPVPPFGDPDACLLIVGLAPGMHGANASGRPFTGDFAGILLYQTLFDFGYSNRPVSEHREDGLSLTGCRITNAVKCLPPQNKPVGGEIRNCNSFLKNEVALLQPGAVILALGRIAHDAVLGCMALRKSDHAFAHGRVYPLAGDRTLVDSYHCSRYNTQTRRLTPTMFHEVFTTIAGLLNTA